VGAAAAAVILLAPGAFTPEPAVAAGMAAAAKPVCAVLLLCVPLRALQGTVVAYGDLGAYAALNALASATFFALLTAVAARAPGYAQMWLATLGFYAASTVAFAARSAVLLKRR